METPFVVPVSLCFCQCEIVCPFAHRKHKMAMRSYVCIFISLITDYIVHGVMHIIFAFQRENYVLNQCSSARWMKIKSVAKDKTA